MDYDSIAYFLCINHRALLPLEKNLILIHITTQGRTQWRTLPRFDPRFLLYFHKIVRLTAPGLSISPSFKSLYLLSLGLLFKRLMNRNCHSEELHGRETLRTHHTNEDNCL